MLLPEAVSGRPQQINDRLPRKRTDRIRLTDDEQFFSMSRLDKLKEFLAIDPNDSFTKYAIGLEYRSMKDHQSAINAFDGVLRDDPQYIAAYYQLAETLREIGKSAQAVLVCRNGIEAARKIGDLHTASELQSLLEVLEDDD
jgi:tetratricopeptide (TPR) repeat protein